MKWNENMLYQHKMFFFWFENEMKFEIVYLTEKIKVITNFI